MRNLWSMGMAAWVVAATTIPSSSAPAIPTPRFFGVYVVQGGKLSELQPIRVVPTMSMAYEYVTEPTRPAFSNGKLYIVVYHRSVATDAPDRVRLNAVSRIRNYVTLDPNGREIKREQPSGALWPVMSRGYTFRVSPIPGNPQMIAIRPEEPGFSLPSGRWVFKVLNERYGFSVKDGSGQVFEGCVDEVYQPGIMIGEHKVVYC